MAKPKIWNIVAKMHWNRRENAVGKAYRLCKSFLIEIPRKPKNLTRNVQIHYDNLYTSCAIPEIYSIECLPEMHRLSPHLSQNREWLKGNYDGKAQQKKTHNNNNNSA